MKYYDHKGEEVSRKMFEFLMEKDRLLNDNCFIDRTKDSLRLYNEEDVIFDEEMRFVGYKNE